MAMETRRNRAQGRAGAFSLLEMLVAVTIFSIAIVAIIEGIATSSRGQIWIEDQSRAVMLAQNIMEEMEYVGEYRLGNDSGQFEGDDSRYSWATEIVDGEEQGLFEVRVAVSWMEGEAQRDFQLITYVHDTSNETTTTMQQ